MEFLFGIGVIVLAIVFVWRAFGLALIIINHIFDWLKELI